MAPKPPTKDKSPEAMRTPAVTDRNLRMSYRIARGEMGVLTFEPYKSFLLPSWRFRTPEIARTSSRDLWAQFVKYGEHGDFVGMDMARKFIQMGMTRAKRYANHKGGKKYERHGKGDDGKGKELPRSTEHKDKAEKEEASLIFREVWERCKADERYLSLKEAFLAEQKQWDKHQKEVSKNFEKSGS